MGTFGTVPVVDGGSPQPETESELQRDVGIKVEPEMMTIDVVLAVVSIPGSVTKVASFMIYEPE